MKSKNKPWLKIIGYVILGFISPITLFILFIIAAAWIKFKTKTFKKEKFIGLIAGLLLFLGINIFMSTTHLGDKMTENSLAKIPVLGTVSANIKTAFPDVTIKGMYLMDMKRVYSDGKRSGSKDFELTFSSDQPFTEKRAEEMAKVVCDTLETENEDVDNVSIKNQQATKISFLELPLHKTLSFRDSCEGWRGEINPPVEESALDN